MGKEGVIPDINYLKKRDVNIKGTSKKSNFRYGNFKKWGHFPYYGGIPLYDEPYRRIDGGRTPYYEGICPLVIF